ncbi:hypothetical protein [Mucilaginibacter flavidus]|uniref:hypothetical protein n=1 Tax=Mucilaginibacter flavidus TaxID=2949309 RepID=UPI0020922B3B|nr:hypothetical protein [Mucilaginibacter flavidus]MCO5950521.1 hypothetical protein [Mucilaginibacter flavidus]
MEKGAQGVLNDDYHIATPAVLKKAKAFRQVFYVLTWRNGARRRFVFVGSMMFLIEKSGWH